MKTNNNLIKMQEIVKQVISCVMKYLVRGWKMKKELIERLLNEFDNDREVIVRNLLEVMDMIVLATTDDYGKIIMTIKYERRDENEKC